MQNNAVFFFEGDDDRRFIESVVAPRVRSTYQHVQLIGYSSLPKGQLEGFIKTFSSLKYDMYFLADLDNYSSKEKRIASLASSIAGLMPSDIYVVVVEIESWYLAGLSPTGCTKCRLTVPGVVETFSKANFEKMARDLRQNRIVLMRQMLQYYSVQAARQRNSSFDAFASVLGIIN